MVGALGLGIFLLGRWTSDIGKGEVKPSAGELAKSFGNQPPWATRSAARADAAPLVKKLTLDQAAVAKARKMTPEERLALATQAMMLTDVSQQGKILCGLIPALTKEEMTEVNTRLYDSMMRGNPWSQDTWDSLWVRWGQVDPAACLAKSGTPIAFATRADGQNFMKGWLESDPIAALAWAKQSISNPQHAAAAAYAISQNANGDLNQMAKVISALPADSMTRRESLVNYFDAAILAEKGASPATIYDGLPATLRSAAWPVAMERLSQGDPEEAKKWLGQHLNDPGRDYFATGRLVAGMARNDPASTAEWASKLPINPPKNSGEPEFHPAFIAVGQWLDKDRAAAKAWLQRQPSGTPWATYFLPKLAAQDEGR